MMKLAIVLALVAFASAASKHSKHHRLNDFCDGKQLNANYKNPDSCESYISCDHAGIARVMPCPSGLHYTEGERPWGHCDYPHLANCEEDPDIPAPGECGNSPDPPVEFSCSGRIDGNYRNPNDCCSYIACSNQRKYVMPCAKGHNGPLHWDWTLPESGDCGPEGNNCLGQCQYPEKAQCGVTPPNGCTGRECIPFSWWKRCCKGSRCEFNWDKKHGNWGFACT